uniref:C2H2-type domain-containing protein n=1 Tax=Macrostomum lignano TaxID=282301 RepID=A0A1I8JPQ0_9PLAT
RDAREDESPQAPVRQLRPAAGRLAVWSAGKQPQQQSAAARTAVVSIVKQALLTNGRPGSYEAAASAATYDSSISTAESWTAAGDCGHPTCRWSVCLQLLRLLAQLPCSDAAASTFLSTCSAPGFTAPTSPRTRDVTAACAASKPRMQRHLSRAHPDCLDESALVCRICELHFDTDSKLADHLAGTHPPGTCLPCELCAHRSSSHADLIQHFYSFHACSGELLCYFCLKVFRFPKCTGSSPTAQSLSPYYSHLRATWRTVAQIPMATPIQTAAQSASCTFSAAQSLKQHLDSAHIGKCFTVAEVSPSTVWRDCSGSLCSGVTAAAGTRSLNAAPASRLCGLAQLKFKVKRQETCLECLQPMSLPGHYQRQHLCPACRYVTCCGEAFARHKRRHRTAASTAAATSAAPAALGDIGVGSA